MHSGAEQPCKSLGSDFKIQMQVAASGPGFVTYQMSPTQPLPVGNYTVVATYTPTAAFLFGSTSNAYTFLVGPAVTSPPPTSKGSSHICSNLAQPLLQGNAGKGQAVANLLLIDWSAVECFMKPWAVCLHSPLLVDA